MPDLLQRLTSPPVQTLRTIQPTLSTIQYTVSTRPIPKTLSARLVRQIGILARVLFGLCTALSVWTKWRVTSEQSISILPHLLGTEREAWLVKLMATCPWHYLAPGSLLILYLVFRRGYIEESLTLLRGLGVQTSTTSSTYLQPPATRFISTTSIQDIVIHEAFRGFEVRFYLAIVVEGDESVVVVFPTLLPRRAVLEEVWRGARKCLWERESVAGGQKKDREKSEVETESI